MSLTRPAADQPTTRLRHTPAAARTDVAPDPVRSPEVSPPRPPSRLLGVGLAIGAVIYGVTWIVESDVTEGSFAIDLNGIAFQLGLFALLAAMWSTHATGTSRLARAMLVVEAVMLGLATIQSGFASAAMGGEWGPVAVALDPFWPLSMLGMAIIGVKVAVAGRWRGALRVWPVFAAAWVVVVIPASILLGDLMGSYVAAGHLIVGYGALGVLLAVRPDLTRR